MTAEAKWALGPKAVMSLSQPKARLPFSCAVLSTAGESVFWNNTSAPPLIRLVAASVSLGGLNHSFTQTTLVLILGLTDCAPSVKLLMLRITSGIGTEPTTPSVLDLVMAPAMMPAMYAPS